MAGAVVLPSGRVIRGRGLRKPCPEGADPTFAVLLGGRRPAPTRWESRWIRWPDFRLPSNRPDAERILREAWDRATTDRVEIACHGGRGRTGTALACLAVLDGVPAAEAVAFIRRVYSRHAVETPWQRRYVLGFPAREDTSA